MSQQPAKSTATQGNKIAEVMQALAAQPQAQAAAEAAKAAAAKAAAAHARKKAEAEEEDITLSDSGEEAVVVSDSEPGLAGYGGGEGDVILAQAGTGGAATGGTATGGAATGGAATGGAATGGAATGGAAAGGAAAGGAAIGAGAITASTLVPLVVGGAIVANTVLEEDKDAAAAVPANPTVDSLTVSGPAGASQVKAGDTLTIVFTFSEPVTFTPGAMPGTVNLDFGGGNIVTATYVSSTSTTATFSAIAPAGNGTSVSLVGFTANDTTVVSAATGLTLSTTAFPPAYTGLILDNAAPVLSSASLNAAENGTAVGTLVSADATTVTYSNLGGADASKFSLTSAGVLTFGAAKNFEAADDADANGVYSLTVDITDALNNVTTATPFTVTLTNVNEAPTVATPIPDQAFVVGGAVDTFQFAAGTFTDPDAGSTLTYTATGMPAGVTFDAATRTFSGNPTANGTATVTVTASDGSLSVTDSFILNSVTAPVAQSFTVADAVGSTSLGKQGDTLTFTVTMSEAVAVTGTPQITFTLGANTVVASYAGGTGTAALTFTGAAPAGNATSVSLTSINLNGGTVTGNVSTQPWITTTVGQTATYTLDNTAPAVSSTTFSAAENGTAVGTLTGTDTNGPVTFALSGAGADNAKFSLTSAGVLTFGAAKNFEAADDAGANRVYDITVVATDAAGNASAAQAVTVTLTNVNEAPTVATPIADQTFVVGGAVDTFTFAAGTFSDPDAGSTLTYTATGMPAGVTFDGATRTFSGNPTAGGTASITVTASDGTLSVTDTFVLTSVSAPSLSTTVGGITNLDPRSSIVLSSTETVTAVSGKNIILTNTGGTGFRGEATVSNMTIAANDTAQVTITGTGSATKIIINPTFDLDLANNYSLAVDTGAFLGSTSTQPSVAFTTVNFGTVTPGAAIGSAAASQIYYTTAGHALGGAVTNALGASLSWFDASNIGNAAGGTYTELDFSTGNYAATLKGITLVSNNTEYEGEGKVQFNGFNANDLIYIDGQDGTKTDDQTSINANVFGGGVGTSGVPFDMTVGGNGGVANAYFVNVVLADPSVLPGTMANSLVQTVISNGWSNTGMVIAG